MRWHPADWTEVVRIVRERAAARKAGAFAEADRLRIELIPFGVERLEDRLTYVRVARWNPAAAAWSWDRIHLP